MKFEGNLIVKSTDEKTKIEVLHKNSWVSLKKLVNKRKGCSGYIFSHETRCDGKIISMLPYRNTPNGIEYLLRNEVTPCWNLDNYSISSITGGVDNNNINETAIHELDEEGGYRIIEDELIFLGTSFGTKSSDSVYYLFSVNLTGKERFEAKGDGTELETKAYCFWSKTINDAVDPFVYVIKNKLEQ